MKKYFRLKAILTTVIVLGVITFMSCNKDEVANINEASKNNTTEIGAREYGYFHNEALSLYYNSINIDEGSKVSKNISAVETFEDIAKELSEKYPSKFKNLLESSELEINESKELFKKYTINNFDFVNFWNENKIKFVEDKKLTKKIVQLGDLILIKTRTYDEYMGIINNFEKNNFLTNQEKEALFVLKNVLTSSNEYWNTTGKAKPGSSAIAADGMGALMFCWNPALSIINGTICSLFVNEAL